MAIEKDLDEALSRLFAAVEVGPLHPQDLEYPYRVVALSPTQALVFRQEASALLRKVSKKLAHPALSGEGLSIEGAENLLVRACQQSLEIGPEEAISLLKVELGKPAKTWIVIEPVRIHFKGEHMQVGRCQLYKKVPSSYADDIFVRNFAPEFQNSVIVASPTAKDEHSARRLAREYMEESLAVVIMADGLHHGADARTSHLIGPEGSPLAANSGKSDWLYLEHVQDRDGRLYPEYSALFEAAARVEQERGDWERRVLAATRWNAIAVTSAWPSEALGASMVALECLFIRDRHVKQKGDRHVKQKGDRHVKQKGDRHVKQKGALIAAAISERWTFRSDQEEWIRKMYRGRNDVIHEGRHYAQEVDVYDLLAILARVLHWGAWHLHDMHRSGGGICKTFDEAMAPHD